MCKIKRCTALLLVLILTLLSIPTWAWAAEQEQQSLLPHAAIDVTLSSNVKTVNPGDTVDVTAAITNNSASLMREVTVTATGNMQSVTATDVYYPLPTLSRSWKWAIDDEIRNCITEIRFVDHTNPDPVDVIQTWDFNNDASIIGWITLDPENENGYILTFGGAGGVAAAPDEKGLFENLGALKYVDFNNFNANAMSFDELFMGCSKLQVVDFSPLGCTTVESFDSTFSYCFDLQNVNFANLDFSECESFNETFRYCQYLNDIDVSGLVTSSCTSLHMTFWGCKSITTTTLDVTDWDTSQVTDMSGLFSGCSQITTLDLRHFDISQVQTLNELVANCYNLSTIDISTWNLSGIDIRDMFNNCQVCVTVRSFADQNFLSDQQNAKLTFVVAEDTSDEYQISIDTQLFTADRQSDAPTSISDQYQYQHVVIKNPDVFDTIAAIPAYSTIYVVYQLTLPTDTNAWDAEFDLTLNNDIMTSLSIPYAQHDPGFDVGVIFGAQKYISYLDHKPHLYPSDRIGLYCRAAYIGMSPVTGLITLNGQSYNLIWNGSQSTDGTLSSDTGGALIPLHDLMSIPDGTIPLHNALYHNGNTVLEHDMDITIDFSAPDVQIAADDTHTHAVLVVSDATGVATVNYRVASNEYSLYSADWRVWDESEAPFEITDSSWVQIAATDILGNHETVTGVVRDLPQSDEPNPEPEDKPAPEEPEVMPPSNNPSHKHRSNKVIKVPVPSQVHTAYMKGYPDGTFRPDASISRAEVATIIARVSDGFAEGSTYVCASVDVPANAWYRNNLGYALEHGLMTGEKEGAFRPEDSITRAEYAAVVARLLGLQNDGQTAFADASNHWATGYIKQLVDMDIINGYSDGTFRPDAPIARSEAVKMMNRALHREPDKAVLSGLYANCTVVFADVSTSHWAHYEVLESAADHFCDSAAATQKAD